MALFRRFILYIFSLSLGLSLTAQAQELQTYQTGRFDVSVPVGDIANPESLGRFAHIYDSEDEISWHIYVPETYDPATPSGVFVFISPTRSGEALGSWYGSLKRDNFIYISAQGAGNRVPANRRMLNAVLAVSYIRAQYETDPQRTVIAGFSGGARISSLVVETIPGIFESGIFMGGAFQWRGDTSNINDRLGGGAYVFMTGRRDHAKGETQRTYKQYKRSGLKHVKFISPRDAAHEFPKRKEFSAALAFVSERLKHTPAAVNPKD